MVAATSDALAKAARLLDPSSLTYLEQVWQLDSDGTFVRPLTDNWGIWIAHDTISHVEFFTSGPEEDDQDGRQQATYNAGQTDAIA